MTSQLDNRMKSLCLSTYSYLRQRLNVRINYTVTPDYDSDKPSFYKRSEKKWMKSAVPIP